MLLYFKGVPWTSGMEADLPSHWEKHGDLVLLPDTCLTLPEWSPMG